MNLNYNYTNQQAQMISSVIILDIKYHNTKNKVITISNKMRSNLQIKALKRQKMLQIKTIMNRHFQNQNMKPVKNSYLKIPNKSRKLQKNSQIALLLKLRKKKAKSKKDCERNFKGNHK